MRKAEGFLLLEALLALTVLSAGVVLLFRAFSACVRGARISEARYRGALAAEEAAWELEAGAELPPALEVEGLRVEVREAEAGDRLAPWTVTARWPERSERASYELTVLARKR